MSGKADPQLKPDEDNGAIERRQGLHNDPGEKEFMHVRHWLQSWILHRRPKRSWLQSISRFLFSRRTSPPATRLERGTASGIYVYLSVGKETLPYKWHPAASHAVLRDLCQAYSRELREMRFDDGVKLLEATAQEAQQEETEKQWPRYAIEDLRKLVKNAKGVRESVGDASRLLFHIMEIETLLAGIEKKARATSRKYEARLAASLRDICRVHDPGSFSEDQAECLKGSVTALAEGWGKLTREKLKYVRTRLLDQGLTWLPVTEKAMADLEETQEPN